MSIQEIETAIRQLPAKEFAQLMARLKEFDAQLWEQQIEEDLEAGRLDDLLKEVHDEIQAGNEKPL